MRREVDNRNKDCEFHGDYVGRDLNVTNIIMFQDSEREFVVTHNADIKPVSYFTGRETELQELRQRIEAGRKSVLVSGMGGIGKTHICRKLFEEYLNKHAEDENGPFRHIGYIEYNEDMGSSLQNCLKFKQQDSPEQNQEAAWRELEYLAADGKLLLFVDNVDKLVGEDVGLQRLKGIPGAVVLTSRQASFSDEFEPYPIGFLDMEQCKEIYEKIRFGSSERKVRPEEVHDLEYIIESLAGKHTITVELLAHLARTKLWAVKRLREELEKKGFRLEFHKDGELVNIQESYEKLYDLSELTGAEQNILEAFSVFPYIPFEAEVCNQWLLADAGASEDDDILMGLYQKGWLQFDMEQESYSMHPVFAQFIYDKYRPEVKKHLGLISKCRENLNLNIRKGSSALECQKCILFAESIVDKLHNRKEGEWNRLIVHLASLLEYMAKYKEAEKWYKISLEFYKDELGESDPNTIALYSNLANNYYWQMKYGRAQELHEKVKMIREMVLGENHLDTAISYGCLAHIYNIQGEYDKALRLYEKSLLIRKKVLGLNHPEIANSYNGLAQVYYNLGKHEKAKDLFEKGLKIQETVLGVNHSETAQSYNDLAGVYYVFGEYEKAEELCAKSLAIRKMLKGEEHPDTADSYNNLARVYESQGKYVEAEELHKKALQIREVVLGEEHPDTAASYNNLAGVYDEQGKYKEAKELYKKALLIRERVLGEEHPNTTANYNNLANVYTSQKEYKKAVSYYLKAYKILVCRLGLNHPNTQIVYKNMQAAYSDWNSEGDFEQWLEEQMKESD